MDEEEEHRLEQMEKADMDEEEEQATNMELKKKEVVTKDEEEAVVEVMSPEVEAELLDLVVSNSNVTCTC